MSIEITVNEAVAWQDAKEKLDEIKAVEMELRKGLINKILGRGVIGKLNEETKLDYENGEGVDVKIKAEQPLKTNLNIKEFLNLKELGLLDELELSCVVDKPTLDKKALIKLREDRIESPVFEFVKDSYAAPTLDIKWLGD